MKVALIGFMGCGKSSVGRRVAEEAGWEFLDLDEEIEKTTGRKIREIFETDGEGEFRKIERKVLKDVLNRKDNLIISLGGGTPTWGDNINLLKKRALLIYLYAPFDVLWERIKDDTSRPLTSLGENKVRNLFEVRKSFYEEADFVVDTSDKSVEGVVKEVLAVLENFISSKRNNNEGE